MKLIAASALVATAAAGTMREPINDLTHLNFQDWKAHHGITFHSEAEDASRFNNWKNTLKFVKEHNEKFRNGEIDFHVAMNKFAHMPNEEFLALYTQPSWEAGTYGEEQGPDMLTTQYSCPTKYTSTSHSTSYSGSSYTTGVKDQGSCGSCWTYGAGATVEAAFCKKGTKTCSRWNGVSTQQLLDCASSNSALNPHDNSGCNGGFQSNALRYYWTMGHGAMNFDDYSYKGKQGSCSYKSSKSIGNVKSCGRLGSAKNEDNMCSMIQDKGTVTVAIDASGLAFQTYNGGVYTSNSCSTSRLNHAVAANAFGTTSGQKTMTIKNSWGTAWGDKGFVHFARNGKNTCGAFSEGQYAIL